MRFITKSALSCALLMLCSCGKDPIALVKEGTLDLDKSVTIENAFKGYTNFTNVEWSTFQDNQKRTIVQVNGSVNIDNYKGKRLSFYSITESDIDSIKVLLNKINYVAQFYINQDGKTFQLKYSGLEVFPSKSKETEIKDERNSMVSSIYRNELDEHTFGVLFSFAQQAKQLQTERFSKMMDTLVGKHPSAIFDASELDSKLKTILKDNYELFKLNLDVASDITQHSDYYEGSGCAPHSCSIAESYFCILRDGRVYVAILNNDKVMWAGEDGNWPQPLRKWVAENGIDIR